MNAAPADAAMNNGGSISPIPDKAARPHEVRA